MVKLMQNWYLMHVFYEKKINEYEPKIKKLFKPKLIIAHLRLISTILFIVFVKKKENIRNGKSGY